MLVSRSCIFAWLVQTVYRGVVWTFLKNETWWSRRRLHRGAAEFGRRSWSETDELRTPRGKVQLQERNVTFGKTVFTHTRKIHWQTLTFFQNHLCFAEEALDFNVWRPEGIWIQSVGDWYVYVAGKQIAVIKVFLSKCENISVFFSLF